MNSFNHHAYGAVADWLYAAAGGIRPGKPGYETVIFEPILDRRLQRFDAEANTPRGKVRSCWSWNGSAVTYTLVSPVSAEVRFGRQTYQVLPGIHTFVLEEQDEKN